MKACSNKDPSFILAVKILIEKRDNFNFRRKHFLQTFLDSTPRCPLGLPMHLTKAFNHPNGYRAQCFQCPLLFLLFPRKTGAPCSHEQSAKGKGCIKDCNWEAGGIARATFNRGHPLYKSVSCQWTSTERGSSQAKALALEWPNVRNIRSVHNLNPLTYLIINLLQ